MSQAEALLNKMALNGNLYGSTPTVEPHIVIGSDRFITVPNELKRLGVQYDHNIETVIFDCPRYWDDTDMSTMNVSINIERIDGATDKYLVDKVEVDSRNSKIMHFEWTISKFVTMVEGTLKFSVCISSIDDDGNEVEHWNSEVCEDCYISKGLETGEQVMAVYPDVINQLRTSMNNILNSGMVVDVSMQKTDGVLTVNVTGPESSESFKIYDGEDGTTPHIGTNGHWWIGTKDTGVTAAASTTGMMPASTYDPRGKRTDIFKYVDNNKFSGSYNDLTNKPTNLMETDVYDPQGKKTDIFKYVHDNGVSAADRAKWNAKSDFSGSYNDLKDIPSNIPTAKDYGLKTPTNNEDTARLHVVRFKHYTGIDMIRFTLSFSGEPTENDWKFDLSDVIGGENMNSIYYQTVTFLSDTNRLIAAYGVIEGYASNNILRNAALHVYRSMEAIDSEYLDMSATSSMATIMFYSYKT